MAHAQECVQRCEVAAETVSEKLVPGGTLITHDREKAKLIPSVWAELPLCINIPIRRRN